jgi:hypothetical protein
MIGRSGEKEFLAPLFKKNTKSGLLAVGKIKDKPTIQLGQCTTDIGKKAHPYRALYDAGALNLSATLPECRDPGIRLHSGFRLRG